MSDRAERYAHVYGIYTSTQAPVNVWELLLFVLEIYKRAADEGGAIVDCMAAFPFVLFYVPAL